MKHTRALIVLALATTVHAVETPELEQLRENYKASIERTNRPIMQAYLVQLERQRDAYARSTKLEGANAVQAEINQIKQALAQLDGGQE